MKLGSEPPASASELPPVPAMGEVGERPDDSRERVPNDADLPSFIAPSRMSSPWPAVVVIVAVLAFAAALILHKGPTTVRHAVPAAAPSCLHIADGTAATNAAIADLDSAASSMRAGDVSGAAQYLRDAASQTRLNAQAMAADPSVAGPLAQAASAMDSAAAADESGDLAGALTQINLVTTYINSATSAVSVSTVAQC